MSRKRRFLVTRWWCKCSQWDTVEILAQVAQVAEALSGSCGSYLRKLREDLEIVAQAAEALDFSSRRVVTGSETMGVIAEVVQQ